MGGTLLLDLVYGAYKSTVPQNETFLETVIVSNQDKGLILVVEYIRGNIHHSFYATFGPK